MNKKSQRLMSLLLVIALAVSLMPAMKLSVRAAEGQSNTLGADDILTMCNPIGRMVKEDNAVRMEASASNFTLTGTLNGDIILDVTVEEITNEYHNLFVEIDGQMHYFELKAGRQSVTVAEGLPAGQHTVQISKGPEAKKEVYYIHGVTYSGKLEKAEPAAHRIEFLGDSITAGTGVYFYDAGFGGTHSYFTYANMTADALGADYYSVANGGWKFSRSISPSDSIGSIYEKTSMHKDLGAYDFSWKPEVVVINLGTNDAIAGRKNTAYTEDTYKTDAAALLDMVRKNNPDAQILWVYGMMLTEREDWIKAAVEAYAQTDEKVHYLHLNGNTRGRGDHPDQEGQITAAKMLIEALCDLMGWTADPAKDPVSISNQQKLVTAARIQKEAAQIDFTKNYCPVCGEIDGWTKLGGNNRNQPGSNIGSAPQFSGNQHFYWDPTEHTDGIASHTGYNWLQVTGSTNVCLHLNGMTLNYTGRIQWGGNGTLNIMGEGSLNALGKSNASSNLGNLYINGGGTVNLYGGKLTSDDTVALYKPQSLTDARYATLSVHNAAATVNIFSGVELESTYGTNIAADMGTVNLYGGTLRGGKGYPYHADTIDANTTEWTVCGGNVYLYGQSETKQAIFNMYGGSIRGGAATRGGNVFVYKNAQFHLYGGSVRSGAADTGDNLFISDAAAFKVGADWKGSASVAFDTLYADGDRVKNGVALGVFSGDLRYEAGENLALYGKNGELVLAQAYLNEAQRIQKEAARIDFSENYCPACGEIDGWTKLGSDTRHFPGTTIGNAPHFSGNQHFYWDPAEYPNATVNSAVYNWLQVNGSTNVCIHLNGMTVNYTGRIHWGGSGTLNIMGEGSLNALGKSNATNNMGNLYINAAGTINLYGGKYTSDDTVTLNKPTSPTDPRYATLSVHNVGATVNIYDGVVLESTFGTNIAVDVGTVNLYGGTLQGGKGYPYHADAIDSATTDWETCGGNVYLYGQSETKRAVFNMYGGRISGGTAQRGGNVFTYKNSSFNLYGGDILDGTAQVGSNLYVHNAAALQVGGNWSGSATVAFSAEYGYGSPIQNGTANGDFTGTLLLESETMPNVYGQDGKLTVASVRLCLPDGSITWPKNNADAIEKHLENDGSYICVTVPDTTFQLPEGETVCIDFCGTPAKITGSGTLCGMDSENDTYEITNGNAEVADTVSLQTVVTHPVSGKRYAAVTRQGITTFHAFELRLSAVTLRTGKAGIYYKAELACDDALRTAIASYGVAVSTAGMPDATFETDGAVSYTRLDGAPAGSFTSGSVCNIFRSSLSTDRNAARGEMKIYGIPYIKLTDGTVLTARAGEAWSLRDVMDYLNGNFASLDAAEQANAKAFYTRWADAMDAWKLTNLQAAA